MILTWALSGCLASLLLAGGAERWSVARARRRIPVRIHVNGTRGKSTVTRLIHAALREAGIPAMARTTGTAARLLLPDGREETWPRRGRPNIREQLRLLRLAEKHGVRALVSECMAIHPALQWTAEREMMQSTIGVLTNVRADHGEIMGRTLEETARCLANTIPQQAVLVHGEKRFESLWGQAAARLGTRVVAVCRTGSPKHNPCEKNPEQDPESRSANPHALPRWLQECRAIALAVARELDIDCVTALRGMDRYRPDPGAAACGRWNLGGGSVPLIDARAANDPESLEQLLEDFDVGSRTGSGSRILIYNHRTDRPERLRACLRSEIIAPGRGLHFLISGDFPCWTLRREAGKALQTDSCPFLSRSALLRGLASLPFLPEAVILCGNSHGLDPREIAGADFSPAG